MLIGFFKKPEECECYIIKYVDRIWLSEIGDAEVLRTFIVKVNENSPKPLREVRLLLPFKRVENLENVTENCFLSPSKYYFNSPEICSTREYKIVHEVIQPARFDSYGIIDHDGIQNIKVFPSIDYSSYKEGDCSVIRLQLPPKEGLKKGECTEIRVKFQISSFFDKITTGLFPNYLVELSYFSSRYINEINQLNRNCEIKVKPVLGLAESQFKGGFDIFLYFPPGFDKVTGFNSFKEKYDFFNIAGEKTSEKRVKLLWRLREFLKQKKLPEDGLSGIGLDMFISGTLIKKYNAVEIIDMMSKRISPDFWTRRMNMTTWLSYIAITISVIAMLFTLVFFLKS